MAGTEGPERQVSALASPNRSRWTLNLATLLATRPPGRITSIPSFAVLLGVDHFGCRAAHSIDSLAEALKDAAGKNHPRTPKHRRERCKSLEQEPAARVSVGKCVARRGENDPEKKEKG